MLVKITETRMQARRMALFRHPEARAAVHGRYSEVAVQIPNKNPRIYYKEEAVRASKEVVCGPG